MKVSEQHPFDVITLLFVLIGNFELVFTCIYMYLHVLTGFHEILKVGLNIPGLLF